MVRIDLVDLAHSYNGNAADPEPKLGGLIEFYRSPAQDSVMERRSKVQGACGPKMNKKESAEYWYKRAEKDGNIAPQRKLANEKPKGETIDYDTLIKSWPATPPKRASN
jgi:hypothetical protein